MPSAFGNLPTTMFLLVPKTVFAVIFRFPECSREYDRRLSSTPLKTRLPQQTWRGGLSALTNGQRLPSHETQAEARPPAAIRQARVAGAGCHRASIWLAERTAPAGRALQQARNKLCRHGHIGLPPAVFATSLFVQCLGVRSRNEMVRIDGLDISL